MYNYLEDKNLNEVYNYLKANNLYEDFIKSVLEENKDYKKMLINAKNFRKKRQKEEKQLKNNALECNENKKSE